MSKAIVKSRGGRPRRELDYALVERLAGMGCTDAEIACVLAFTPEWICKRKKVDQQLRESIETGREKGRATLRRMQWQAASDGNPTMLIWLGKQMLGQRDRFDHELTGKDGGPVRTEISKGLSADFVDDLKAKFLGLPAGGKTEGGEG